MSKAHRSARPKGYMRDWTPIPRQAETIRQVLGVINSASYEVSVRFIFYRLVGNHGYPKTEKAYNNLVELLVKARRAELIPFGAISDSDPLLGPGASGWESRAQYLRAKASVRGFQLDPGEGQPYHLELWSEDAGSIPMLESITRGLPVDIYSTGGFSSITVTYDVAQRVLSRDVPTILLHIGDYDPSGESIYTSMSQDVGAFAADELRCSYDERTGETYHCEDEGLEESGEDSGPDFRPVRVALTEAQAIDWGLQTAPPKASDSRSENWVARQSGALGGETVQVQAMSEQQMRRVVMDALGNYFDYAKMQEVVDRSEELRDEMSPLVRTAMEGVIEELGE